MVILLFKISIIWGLLLLLYFTLLQKEKSYIFSRIYLWLVILSGVSIPVIASYFEILETKATTLQTDNFVFNTAEPVANTAAQNTTLPVTTATTWEWHQIVWTIWLAGALIQLYLFLKNIIYLYRLKAQGRLVPHPVADYYMHSGVTQPFSFGSSIFIPEKPYTEEELEMILHHEHYHHLFRHTTDNILLGIGRSLFWFHPLYHILQHQLKLLHEYQVDERVAQQYGYDYGRLLIRQAGAGAPGTLANTFYYSPLKNRIAMLVSNKKSRPWKYLFSFPVLALSFLFMSADKPNDERVRNGNTTTFRGNTFTWADPPTDSVMLTDAASGAQKYYAMPTFERIVRYNGQEVKEGLVRTGNTMQEEFRNKQLETLTDNIAGAIEANIALFPQKMATVTLENLILNEQGDILYYDVKTLGVQITDTTISGTNRFPDVNKTVDKILKDKKLINPNDLKLDNVYTVKAVALLREYEPMKARFISAPLSED